MCFQYAVKYKKKKSIKTAINNAGGGGGRPKNPTSGRLKRRPWFNLDAVQTNPAVPEHALWPVT